MLHSGKTDSRGLAWLTTTVSERHSAAAAAGTGQPAKSHSFLLVVVLYFSSTWTKVVKAHLESDNKIEANRPCRNTKCSICSVTVVTVNCWSHTVQLSLVVTFCLMQALLGLQLTILTNEGAGEVTRGWGGQTRAQKPLAAMLCSLCPLVISDCAFAKTIIEYKHSYGDRKRGFTWPPHSVEPREREARG